MKTHFLIPAVLIMGLCLQVHAQITHREFSTDSFLQSERFEQAVLDLRNRCPESDLGACLTLADLQPSQQVVYQADGHSAPVVNESRLSSEMVARLKEIAGLQTEIWADTILEGPFEADGRTLLEKVVEMRIGSQLIGYQIQYSQGAWLIETCGYDYVNRAMLAHCPIGRIREASFVSPELKVWIRDPSFFARFE